MSYSKYLGGVLLIVGTSIGGGMLALPMANAEAGLLPSSFALFLCWLVMTCGAFLILEVNLYVPPGKHMVSMAFETLKTPGLIVTWITYLLLLYTLLSAYISGGSDVLQGVLARCHIKLLDWQSTTVFTLAFGLIVYGGIQKVDWANRLLMFGKLGIYFILIFFIAPSVEFEHWTRSMPEAVPKTLMILNTSFGFAIIVPNLRAYFNDDIKSLKSVILVGSLIPLVCYLAWDAVIMGTIPAEGKQGLITLTQSTHPTTDLANQLTFIIHNPIIDRLFRTFTSICMLTAFLGVALCMMSFLGDGLKLRQRGFQGLSLSLITFVPPFILVLFFPGAYLGALRYAGMLCVILLVMLPALMALFGRRTFDGPFKVPGGALPPLLLLGASFGLLFLSF